MQIFPPYDNISNFLAWSQTLQTLSVLIISSCVFFCFARIFARVCMFCMLLQFLRILCANFVWAHIDNYFQPFAHAYPQGQRAGNSLHKKADFYVDYFCWHRAPSIEFRLVMPDLYYGVFSSTDHILLV